ncbi:MAG: hypothetical protein IIW18_04250, partial [Oscillospiraceae bacterium]|nr:hypothetical protein [Oscillospiraceae bacterium]
MWRQAGKFVKSPLLRRTSVSRSETLAQGGFTPPEQVKSPLGRAAAGREAQKKSPLLRRTSVSRSETSAQGGFTPPEQVKSPLERAAAGREAKKRQTAVGDLSFFGGLEGDRFSAEKPRRLQHATGMLPRAAFRSPASS